MLWVPGDGDAVEAGFFDGEDQGPDGIVTDPLLKRSPGVKIIGALKLVILPGECWDGQIDGALIHTGDDGVWQDHRRSGRRCDNREIINGDALGLGG